MKERLERVLVLFPFLKLLSYVSVEKIKNKTVILGNNAVFH